MNAIPIYWEGIAKILAKIPNDSIDCVITSPPYWQMREYSISEEECDSVLVWKKHLNNM